MIVASTFLLVRICCPVGARIYALRSKRQAIYDKESMELLIKRIGVDNVLFATEMFGAVNAIDPKTGRNFEDLVPIFQSIDWLSDEERHKITEGNARKVFSRMFAEAKK